MALRNFWLETEIDGRKTKLKGGPKGRTGSMRTNIYVRDQGASALACKIVCRECVGDLIVMIYDKDDQLIYTNTTER
jgi:hypothetical protein